MFKQHRVYDESGISMLPMLLMPFAQLPVTLGMFFAVKRLCALPLKQLHHSSISFLPDLTIPDPYYILPIVSAVLMNLQLSVRVSSPRYYELFFLVSNAIWASDMAVTADCTTEQSTHCHAPNVKFTAFISEDPAPTARACDGLRLRIGCALAPMLPVPATTATTVRTSGKIQSGAARRRVSFVMISCSTGTESSAGT